MCVCVCVCVRRDLKAQCSMTTGKFQLPRHHHIQCFFFFFSSAVVLHCLKEYYVLCNFGPRIKDYAINSKITFPKCFCSIKLIHTMPPSVPSELTIFFTRFLRIQNKYWAGLRDQVFISVPMYPCSGTKITYGQLCFKNKTTKKRKKEKGHNDEMHFFLRREKCTLLWS